MLRFRGRRGGIGQDGRRVRRHYDGNVLVRMVREHPLHRAPGLAPSASERVQSVGEPPSTTHGTELSLCRPAASPLAGAVLPTFLVSCQVRLVDSLNRPMVVRRQWPIRGE